MLNNIKQNYYNNKTKDSSRWCSNTFKYKLLLLMILGFKTLITLCMCGRNTQFCWVLNHITILLGCISPSSSLCMDGYNKVQQLREDGFLILFKNKRNATPPLIFICTFKIYSTWTNYQMLCLATPVRYVQVIFGRTCIDIFPDPFDFNLLGLNHFSNL